MHISKTFLKPSHTNASRNIALGYNRIISRFYLGSCITYPSFKELCLTEK